MRAIPFIATLCLLAGAVFGQGVPTLTVRGDDRGSRVPLRISEFHADVLIAGASASTTLTLVFQNDYDRQLEGRLELPIGKGRTVSRFAMDVNGKIREGVVVERNKARRVFEEIVARRVDPGLLSWVDGSNYEARVFPIPKRGTKTIVVRYEELLRFRGGNHLQYSLPVDYGVRFDRFRARVRFANPDTRLRRWQRSLLEFPEEGEQRGVAEIDELNFLPDQRLQVSFSIDSDCVVTAPREGGGRYFFTRPTIHGGDLERARAKRVALLWDNSGSARERNLPREIGFLDAYFGRLGDAEVVLGVFGHEAMPPETFKVEAGKWKALRARIEGLQGDGATDFGKVDWTWVDGEDEILLFSDGAGTLGETVLEAMPTPVFPVVSKNIFVGDSLLARLAAASGGRVVSLEGRLEDALSAIQSTPGRLFRVEGDGDGAPLSELLPDDASFADRPLVAGVIEGDAQGTLVLVHGTRPSDPRTTRLDVPAHDADAADVDPELASLAYQMWVRAKLDSIKTQRRTRWREVADLSTEAGLVTPDSSLLVLDFLNDYVKNRIPPPANEPEFLAQYLDRVKAPRPPRAEEQFAAVKTRFDAWYTKPFPWLEETNWRLAKHGANYVRDLARRRPDREDFAEDFGRLQPLVERADALKKEHLRIVGGTDEERDAWLARAMALQMELEPFKAKYGDHYLKRQAAIRRVTQKYARDERGSDDPFGTADGFSSSGAGDDPFAAGDAGGSAGADRGGRALDLSGGSIRSGKVEANTRWKIDAPHIAKLRAADDEADFTRRYFEEREFKARDPLFFVDAGDIAAEMGFDDLAVRILSNLAELKLDDVRLLRMLAYRLDTHGRHLIANGIYQHIARLVQEDGVARRDVALSYERCGELQKAFDGLWHIVSIPRYSSLNAIVLTDLKQLLAADEKEEIVLPEGAEGLREPVELDLRVVMTWDTDAVEIDLVVVEPSNGLASGESSSTLTGGQTSGVGIGGYGPEQYLVKRALPGDYSIRAIVRPGRKRGSLPAPSTVYVDITKGFGSDNPQSQLLAVRVTTGESEVASVRFSAADVVK